MTGKKPEPYRPEDEQATNREVLAYLEQEGQFDFWKAPEEDIYTLDDGKDIG